MKAIIACLLALITLGGCGIEEGIKRSDERYLKPGALDLPLTNVYDTYQYKFLEKYRINHQWPTSAGSCKYRSRPTLGVDRGLKGEFFYVPDIYEANGHTWQAGTKTFEEAKRTHYVNPKDPKPPPTFDAYAYSHSFDRYVRSVKVKNPVYGQVNGVRQKTGEEEIEAGLQSMCHQSWYATQHGLSMLLRKWSVDQYLTWLKTNVHQPGQVSQRRVGTNHWTVLEFNLEPQSTDGASSGPYQFWMLPIGETGYTFLFRLGANLESIKYPQAHARFQAAFHQLIESVKIEPLRP